MMPGCDIYSIISSIIEYVVTVARFVAILLIKIGFCFGGMQRFWKPNQIQSSAEKDSWTDGLTFILLIDFYLELQQSSFWHGSVLNDADLLFLHCWAQSMPALEK